MRVLHKSAVFWPRLRSLAINRRLRLVAILVALVIGVTSGLALWYVPNRSDIILQRALSRSLQQTSVAFRLQTSGSSESAVRVDGRVGEGGDFMAEVSRNDIGGQRFSVIGVDGEVYLQGQDGQWLSVPSQLVGTLLPGVSGATSEKVAAGLSDADRGRLEMVYGRYAFVEIIKIWPDEEIAGMLSRHYEVRVNKQQLQRFLQAARQEVPALGLRTNQIKTIINATWLDRSASIWISKHDGLIRKIAYRSESGSSSAPGGFDASWSVTFLSYGQQIQIIKPQSTQSLLDTIRR